MSTSSPEVDPADAAGGLPPQVGDPSSWGPERSRTVSWHDPRPTALVGVQMDSVAGCAVHTTLPAGVGYTSLEIKVSYLRMAHAGAELRARGKVVKPGSRVAFAEAEILDPDDKLIATATSSFLIMKP